MKKFSNVRVELGERSYDIAVSAGLLRSCSEQLAPFVQGKNVLLVTDSNVERLYAEPVSSLMIRSGAAKCTIHYFTAGESSKNFETVEKICRAAFDAGLDRSGVIVALGGGVTGDMAGFAAAIFMRGIQYIQIPTSLLAMIDSSVGGKTAVDLPEGKNLIGAFHQPELVLMDIELLKTLPKDQIRSGCAELLKHAVLFDPELFELLMTESETILKLSDSDIMTAVIARSCELKAAVVAGDEREGADRALLNLGHSFGHAVEKLQHFCGFSHGAAVAYGVAVASRLAVRCGLLDESEKDRIIELFRRYELPVSFSGFEPEEILAAMQGDKKNIGGKKRLVLPLKIGSCKVFDRIPDQDILAAIGDSRCE